MCLHLLLGQGLPFAIAGVGDLLALFRCVSCRYRFTTDVTRPALMGAIGRVYSSCEVRAGGRRSRGSAVGGCLWLGGGGD
jgi:hypothetical protein